MTLSMQEFLKLNLISPFIQMNKVIIVGDENLEIYKSKKIIPQKLNHSDMNNILWLDSENNLFWINDSTYQHSLKSTALADRVIIVI